MTRRDNREGAIGAWRSPATTGNDMHIDLRSDPPADSTPLRRSGVVKKLHPHQNGARRLADRFGDRLVCVRYRTDPESGRRFTTVEIVVEERSPTTPEASLQLVRVGWKETRLRDAIKASGGIWMPDMKLWKVSGSTIRRLKLQKRIVTESA